MKTASNIITPSKPVRSSITPLKLTSLAIAISLSACTAVNENSSVEDPVKKDSSQISHSQTNTPVSHEPVLLEATDDYSADVREEEKDVVGAIKKAKEHRSKQSPELKTEMVQAPVAQRLLTPSSGDSATSMPAEMMVRKAIAHMPVSPAPVVNTENYHHFEENGMKFVANEPVSTFSIDVDTGSYSNVRRFLNQGQLPRQDAVRTEEMINYFNYGYEPPKDISTPFAVYTEMAPSPWSENSKLLHIGLKGYEVPKESLPAANLVFLIDVSGSMTSANKLGLLKQGFRLLTNQLRPQDTISIAVYAGASGVALEPTSGDQKHKILSAIDQLRAGGSTNGAAGINLAYQLAKSNFKKEGINRVILATDGDFNVGTVNFEALTDLVEQKRKSGIALTTLGFGTGNYNDHLMEQLADKGNGNYAYIDSLQEARKVLVEEMGSTLKTIAKDVKIQIEFNPQLVSSYRLIGYENRALKREDFNNDKIDAGEIGAGHTVTAIYELDLKGSENGKVDPLRYGNGSEDTARKVDVNGEVAFLKLRYKQPSESKSQLIRPG